VADLQTLLTDLRLWLDEMELGIRALPGGNRADVAHTMLSKVGGRMVETIDALHERFEGIVSNVEIDLRPAHQSLAQRQLRSLFLSSPFGYRAFSKPLGYAGDYEMVNMITRDPLEGSTLFAKVMNLWLLEQWPSKAHRNRIAYLRERLVEETARATRQGRRCRVLNLGCGPGRLLAGLARRGVPAVGVDHSRIALIVSRNAVELIITLPFAFCQPDSRRTDDAHARNCAGSGSAKRGMRFVVL